MTLTSVSECSASMEASVRTLSGVTCANVEGTGRDNFVRLVELKTAMTVWDSMQCAHNATKDITSMLNQHAVR